MKFLAAALGVALALSIGGNAYQALPSGAPPKPVYVQRVIQLLEATNTGQWKQACDAAPTAAYSYQDFISIAIMYGATSLKQLGPLCEKMLQSALTDLKGKPVGVDYQILWWSPDDGKATGATDRLVIVQLKWNGEQARTITFHVNLARVPWNSAKSTCKGKPCASLRWYVLGAS